jgi:hypothetical protein
MITVTRDKKKERIQDEFLCMTIIDEFYFIISVTRAKKEGRIQDEFSCKTIIDEINKYGSKCSG